MLLLHTVFPHRHNLFSTCFPLTRDWLSHQDAMTTFHLLLSCAFSCASKCCCFLFTECDPSISYLFTSSTTVSFRPNLPMSSLVVFLSASFTLHIFHTLALSVLLKVPSFIVFTIQVSTPSLLCTSLVDPAFHFYREPPTTQNWGQIVEFQLFMPASSCNCNLSTNITTITTITSSTTLLVQIFLPFYW